MTMNNERQSRRLIDERFLDRLVDNELDAADRHELLVTLDESPDGWRRCALAFLEAQAWRNDLRGAVGEPAPAKAPAAHAIPRRRLRAVRIGQAGLIVAVVIVAFGAGWLIRPGGDDRRPVDSRTAPFSVVERENEVEKRHDLPTADPEESGPDGKPDVRVAGTLTLEVEDRGQPRTLRVPVIEGRGIDMRWLLEQPPAMRASVVRALERRGHRVEAHRQLVTFNLKNGRKLILPVDEVDVRFAGRVFQ
jgi:hypothetical protein